MADLRTTVLRRVMKTGSTITIALYRRTHGRVMGKVGNLPVLLLTVPGRTTGLPRTTAVAYMEDSGGFVVTGSAGSDDAEPQWFRNLRVADAATVEVGPRRLAARVEVLSPTERARLWPQLVELAPNFEGYQRRTDREIPMARLTPRA